MLKESYLKYKKDKDKESYTIIYDILLEDYRYILWKLIPNHIYKRYYEDFMQDFTLILEELFIKFDTSKSLYIRAYFNKLAKTYILNSCKTRYFDLYSLNRKPNYPTINDMEIEYIEGKELEELEILDPFILKEIKKYLPNIIKERNYNWFILNTMYGYKIKDIAIKEDLDPSVVSKGISTVTSILSKDKKIKEYYDKFY